MKGLGITATDTDTGKTVTGGALAAALSARGMDVGVYKPAASGCTRRDGGAVVSGDVEFLLAAAGLSAESCGRAVSYLFEAALSPAEAARLAGLEIDPRVLVEDCKKILASHKITIVEGAGGISAPFTKTYLAGDFFREAGFPLVIVVRPVLGSVNHLVLTADYMKNHGIEAAGVIVNCWDEEKAGVLEWSNLSYYEKLTGLPVFGKLPPLPPEIIYDRGRLALAAEQNINIDAILERIGVPAEQRKT